jgi:hypothetical protein
MQQTRFLLARIRIVKSKITPVLSAAETLNAAPVEAPPTIPAKTWKPLQYARVAFNLSKIQKISGSEKIDLLRDYLRTKSTSEAVFVYETIIFNGISNRLEYKDHHNLFRCCLSDVVKNQEVIIKIRHQLEEHGFFPTEYFLNEYMGCLMKWGHLEAALKSLKECLDEKMTVYPRSWEAFFAFYLFQNDENSWNRGVALWTKMNGQVPIIRPSSTIYIQIMNLYAKLSQNEKAYQVYVEAEDNISRLLHVQSKRSEVEDSETARSEMHTQFFNAYLVSFTEVQQIDDIHNAFRDYFESGAMKTTKAASQTFNILFKMVSKLSEVDKQYQYASGYWGDMELLGIRPDYLHYSRMISFQKNKDELEMLYREAISSLNIGISSSKRQALNSTYIATMSYLDPLFAFESLSDQRNDKEMKKPLRLAHIQLYEQLLQSHHDEEAQKVKEWTIQDDL